MKHLSVGTLALVIVSLAALGCGDDDASNAAECEKESALKRFEGTVVSPDPLPYTSGMDVTVDGIYGSIETDFGPTGEVSVVFEPFNQRECAEVALEEMENNLDTSFEASEDAIVVRTVRHGATKGLGADITVFLPPEFDGALVLQNQGDGLLGSGIDVVNAGNAQSVDVSNEKDGSCYLTGNGVASTRARCAGTIYLAGVSDHIDVASTGPKGNVDVIFRSVAGEGAGGSVITEDGNVSLVYPDGSNFFVAAELAGNGRISWSTGNANGCTTEGDDRSALNISCGSGGPTYSVTGGTGADTPDELTFIRISRSF